MAEEYKQLLESIFSQLDDIRKTIVLSNTQISEVVQSAVRNCESLKFVRESLGKMERKLISMEEQAGLNQKYIEEKILFHKKEAIETAKKDIMIWIHRLVLGFVVSIGISVGTTIMKVLT